MNQRKIADFKAALYLVGTVDGYLERHGLEKLPDDDPDAKLNRLLNTMRNFFHNGLKYWNEKEKDESNQLRRELVRRLFDSVKADTKTAARILADVATECDRSIAPVLFRLMDLEHVKDLADCAKDLKEAVISTQAEVKSLRTKGSIQVSLRTDGKGDPWANLHRTKTDRRCLMGDIDGIEVMTDCGPMLMRGEDALFHEYACHTRNGVLDVEVIAVFDRKIRRSDSWNESQQFKSSVYQGICYNLAKGQFIKPRFFFVYGDNQEWQIEEVDPVTGQRTGRLFTLDQLYSWEPVWNELGLMRDRQRAIDYLRYGRTK